MLAALLVLYLGLMASITAHEMAHYVCVKRLKIFVDSFSVGVGPIIFQRKPDWKTHWTIRLLPIGGSVGFKTYFKITPMNRVLLYGSGPMVNLMIAAILVSCPPLRVEGNDVGRMLILLNIFLGLSSLLAFSRGADGFHVLKAVRDIIDPYQDCEMKPLEIVRQHASTMERRSLTSFDI